MKLCLKAFIKINKLKKNKKRLAIHIIIILKNTIEILIIIKIKHFIIMINLIFD